MVMDQVTHKIMFVFNVLINLKTCEIIIKKLITIEQIQKQFSFTVRQINMIYFLHFY